MAKDECNCPEGAPPWLCTYSDLMSLLLCFFVLIVSMSSTDPNEFNKATGSLKGSLGVLTENAVTLGMKEAIVWKVSDVNIGELSMAVTALQDFAETQGQQNGLNVVITSQGIAVRILTPILFEPGSAEIRPQGMPYLAKIFELAKDWENTIRVCGHTDDTVISNSVYSSNWELAYARARNVARFGMNYAKLDPKRFSIVSYGEYRPAYPNDSEANRQKNRRIEIFIEYAITQDPLM